MQSSGADLARVLSEQSFVTVKLPTDLQEMLASLDLEAQAFFRTNTATAQDIERSTTAWRTLVPRANGGTSLLGFNAPSNLKALFRYHRGCSNMMTWPSSSFQAKVEACECRLAGYLIECFDTVCAELFPGRAISYERLMSSTSECQKDSFDPNPLDLFYYYNTGNSGAFNCDPHADRGLMHIVYSSSPGLEVFDPRTGEWQQAGGNDAGDDRRIPGTAVVFCNDAFATITSEGFKPRDQGKAEVRTTEVPACVHRVVQGNGPRLSISMELRLS